MRIGLDIMGGDFAPQATVAGAVLAYKELPSTDELVLIGNKEMIEAECNKLGFDSSLFTIVNTTEVIEMGDHPARAFVQKPNSSIVVGFSMLARKEIDGFASAGSTGAMMVGAFQVIKPVEGIIRPCITSLVPKLEQPGHFNVLLDVGLNADCKPEVLGQYGLIGSLYAQYVNGVSNPRVSLLNIGSEKEKGNLVTKAAYGCLEATKGINFAGNIEGDELFSDKTDVIVCDGFVGNIVLKFAESTYRVAKFKNASDDFYESMNYENIGGTPVLGINATVIVGHGISNDKAVKSMIFQTARCIKAGLPEKIKNLLQ